MRAIAARELRAVFGERHFVAVGFDAAGLVRGRPDAAACHVTQENVRAAIVARRIFAPTRDALTQPPAVSGACRSQHDRIPGVRKKMRLRRGILRAAQPAHFRRLCATDTRRSLDFLGPWMGDRNVARRALLQQQFRRAHAGLRMKPRAHPAIEQHVRDGHDGHPLMVRHEGSHDRDVRAFRQTRRCVVERFVETIATACARRGEPGEIARRGLRIDHRCKAGSVGRNHHVLAQAAFETEAGHAEVRVLIGQLEVARVVGGLGNAPRRVAVLRHRRSAGARSGDWSAPADSRPAHA